MISGIRKLSAALLGVSMITSPVFAEDNAFTHGWTLDGAASHLNFLSVKKGSVMEVSSFATLEGSIGEDGTAQFEVLLDSIDTKIDLRNVRMRFLMFETFTYPKAVVTAELSEDMLRGLSDAGHKVVSLPFRLDLHGVQRDIVADVSLKLNGPDTVSVSSMSPIVLKVEDFSLMGGLEKLQDAAEVVIVPTTAVTFSLNFQRNSSTAPALLAAAGTTIDPSSAAIESAGEFSHEECAVRFETLSRSGNIHFAQNSARLAAESAPILESVADIVGKCPDMMIEVAGHTDSIGRDDYNMTLSEDRAQSVVDHLTELGLSAARFESKGYGEARPIASNEDASGRGKNRRIEFSILGFENGNS